MGYIIVLAMVVCALAAVLAAFAAEGDHGSGGGTPDQADPANLA